LAEQILRLEDEFQNKLVHKQSIDTFKTELESEIALLQEQVAPFVINKVVEATHLSTEIAQEILRLHEGDDVAAMRYYVEAMEPAITEFCDATGATATNDTIRLLAKHKFDVSKAIDEYSSRIWQRMMAYLRYE
jgi:hypothetical protein